MWPVVSLFRPQTFLGWLHPSLAVTFHDVEHIPQEISRHYRMIQEGRRITQGLGELELIRTQEVVRRHLDHPASRILDVGGGTGVHAAWLAEEGYAVHVVDPMPHHVEEAARRRRVSAEVGDARQLPVPDDSFDAAQLRPAVSPHRSVGSPPVLG
jgi:SAM-dependent methyltransferase